MENIPEELYQAIRSVVRINTKIQEYLSNKKPIPDIFLIDLNLQVNTLKDWLPETLEDYLNKNLII